MKQFMIDHVSTNQDKMFRDATTEVKRNLDTMCEQVKATMRGRVNAIYEAISRDYMTIVGVEANKNRSTGKVEKTARKQVNDAISQSNVYFGEVLDCDPDLLGAAGLVGGYGGAGEGDYEAEAEAEDASAPLFDLDGEGALIDGDENGESEDDDY